ncbi:MAG: peptidoglycan-binding protein [Lachnospiraceae bacterium]|jgi:peptidoglycan hydrolase-like protein with peptidoglycan-binding domain|nr:peptidoglycan-binding protein [Lachnospiraceae bacterium]
MRTEKNTRRKWRKKPFQKLGIYGTLAAAIAVAGLIGTACSKEASVGDAKVSSMTESIVIETTPIEITTAPESIPPLEPGGQLLPNIAITVPEVEPMPEYIRVGDRHSAVVNLQSRLMELGFMDSDEPTDYYGTQTERAVKIFQRQNKLAMDGIVGSATYDAIMDPAAKYYAVRKGDEGDDISQLQNRLYELGYLATADLITGNFGDSTEAAVLKLQEVNSLEADGMVGQKTMNLLYSDEIKANFLSYGEKSEVVLAAQERLKSLGYLMTEPDGAFGDDTAAALRQFQSRNDLIVDGYLGPSTRDVLNGSEAVPNGMRLGDQGDQVKKVQSLLSKYGYLNAANATGYYGEITEKAVKNFQKQNKLTQDGSVGVQTLAKLTGDNVKRAPAGSSSSSSGSSGSSRPSSGSSGGSSSGGSQGSSGGTTIKNSGGVASLIAVAQSKVGCPYVWGAKGPNSFDCSGFVYWCLNQVGVKQSYLTSSGWRSVGRYTKITSFSNIQAGDIVVVKGHVGIAAGGGTVIDASSSNGRVVHRSLSSWWANNFICAWRIFG